MELQIEEGKYTPNKPKHPKLKPHRHNPGD